MIQVLYTLFFFPVLPFLNEKDTLNSRLDIWSTLVDNIANEKYEEKDIEHGLLPIDWEHELNQKSTPCQLNGLNAECGIRKYEKPNNHFLMYKSGIIFQDVKIQSEIILSLSQKIRTTKKRIDKINLSRN